MVEAISVATAPFHEMAKTILDPQSLLYGWQEGDWVAREQVVYYNLKMFVPRLARGAPSWKPAKPQGSKMVVAISLATSPSHEVAKTISDPCSLQHDWQRWAGR